MIAIIVSAIFLIRQIYYCKKWSVDDSIICLVVRCDLLSPFHLRNNEFEQVLCVYVYLPVVSFADFAVTIQKLRTN